MKPKTAEWLFVPAALVVLVDILFTLIGQSPEYWSNFSLANEANPIGHWALTAHPLLFLLLAAPYLLLIYLLIKRLPTLAGLTFILSIIIGHTVGGSSWVVRLYYLGLSKICSPIFSSINSLFFWLYVPLCAINYSYIITLIFQASIAFLVAFFIYKSMLREKTRSKKIAAANPFHKDISLIIAPLAITALSVIFIIVSLTNRPRPSEEILPPPIESESPQPTETPIPVEIPVQREDLWQTFRDERMNFSFEYSIDWPEPEKVESLSYVEYTFNDQFGHYQFTLTDKSFYDPTKKRDLTFEEYWKYIEDSQTEISASTDDYSNGELTGKMLTIKNEAGLQVDTYLPKPKDKTRFILLHLVVPADELTISEEINHVFYTLTFLPTPEPTY